MYLPENNFCKIHNKQASYVLYLYHILQRKFIDNIFKSNIKQINNELRT